MRELILLSTVLQTVRKMILNLCLSIVLVLHEDLSFVLLKFALLLLLDLGSLSSHFLAV